MTSNPQISEIPEQPVRLLVINHVWVVPVDQRPQGWQSLPVGVLQPAVVAVKPADPKCAKCDAPFKPRTRTQLYCSHKCSRSAENLRQRGREAGA